MKVLASLSNLEVLKLKEKAFTGNYWEAMKDVFLHLKVLFVGSTDLMLWKTSAGIFPELVHLELHNCDNLREVPPAFAGSPSLNVLTLNYCGNAVASAKAIRDERVKMMENKGGKTAEFKLSIFPV